MNSSHLFRLRKQHAKLKTIDKLNTDGPIANDSGTITNFILTLLKRHFINWLLTSFYLLFPPNFSFVFYFLITLYLFCVFSVFSVRTL